MKKNNKGFILLETLLVSTFIITVLIYLYIQFSNVKKSYDISFKYDTIQSLYGLKEISKFINNNYGYGDFKDDADNSDNKYIELYNDNTCKLTYFSDNFAYCNKIMSNLNIKTLLFVSSDVSYLKNKLKTNNPYSNNLYLYLRNLDPYIADNAYILIAEFNDKSFATLKIDERLPKCIRAKTLHKEKCNRDDSNGCKGAGYSKGATITYGNLGTKGTLASGDAFDCDINGDGKYDYNTERFYYVSDYYDTEKKEFNDKFAVLIYYSNTYNGIVNNQNEIAYYSSNENWHGPTNAINNLPTKKQWKNISLYINKRQLLANNNATSTTGGTLPTDFDYSNYSARLLTSQEILSPCNISSIGSYEVGEVDNCNYMLENTSFVNTNNSHGFWLETPHSGTANYTFNVRGDVRYVNTHSSNALTGIGVRPVIELNKNDIDY